MLGMTRPAVVSQNAFSTLATPVASAEVDSLTKWERALKAQVTESMSGRVADRRRVGVRLARGQRGSGVSASSDRRGDRSFCIISGISKTARIFCSLTDA